MAKKTIYRTVVTYEVLSDQPINSNTSLSDIIDQCINGDYSGMELDMVTTTLTGKRAANAVLKQGSDPGFFDMDEDGNEVDTDPTL